MQRWHAEHIQRSCRCQRQQCSETSPLHESGHSPEGEGAARTGNRPRWIWHWRATPRPTSVHFMPSFFSVGITSVRMGIGGRYLLIRLAVWPAETHTTILRLTKLRIFWAPKRGSRTAVGQHLMQRLATARALGRPGTRACVLPESYHSLTESYHSLTESYHSLTESYHSLTESYHSLTESYHSLNESYHSLTELYVMLDNCTVAALSQQHRAESTTRRDAARA